MVAHYNPSDIRTGDLVAYANKTSLTRYGDVGFVIGFNHEGLVMILWKKRNQLDVSFHYAGALSKLA